MVTTEFIHMSRAFRSAIDRLRKVWSDRKSPYALLAVITFALYFPVQHFEFVNYDDFFFVKGNQQVLSGLSIRSVRYAFTQMLGFYHPITWLSLTLDAHIFGANSAAFHLTNLWIHVANVLLVFAFLTKLLRSKLLAFGVALIFALHPANIESVAWISERKGLLSASFFLLGIIDYMKFIAGEPKVKIWRFLLFFVLSLLSKPTYLLAIPALIFALFYLQRRSQCSAIEQTPYGVDKPSVRIPAGRTIVVVGIVAISFSVVIGALTIQAEKNMGTLKSLNEYSQYDRIAVSIMCFAASIRNILFPESISPISLWKFPPTWIVFVASVLLVLSTFQILRRFRQWPLPAVAWLWLTSMILPISGIIKHGSQLTAHRYLYLPIVAILIVLTAPFAGAIETNKYARRMFAALLVAGASICFVSSWINLPNWQDSTTLWTSAIAHTEDNWVAENNLGVIALQKRDLLSAENHFKSALAARPGYFEAISNLGEVYALQERWRKSLLMFRLAEALEPKDGSIQTFLGLVSQKLGNTNGAIYYYDKAIAFDPDNMEALDEYAELLNRLNSTKQDLLRAFKMEEHCHQLFLDMNQGREADYRTMALLAQTKNLLAQIDRVAFFSDPVAGSNGHPLRNAPQ